MTQAELVKYLGRSLTPLEVTNLTMYLEIALEHLEALTCLNLKTETTERIYDVRKGYQTVFTDLFKTITNVEIDGNVITDYKTYQWDRRNATWFNSIVLKTSADEIAITADWGMPSVELSMLQAKLFGLIGDMNNSKGLVKSKQVEDFRVTFSDNSEYDQFVYDNQALISRYSICNIGEIKHGSVWSDYDYRFRFI